MKVELVESLSTDARPEAWRLYTEVFDDLRFRAVRRQVMYRPEFDSVMTDRRVSKCLAQDDGGGLRGLSTFTNDLAAVPLISPEYFERRWPDRFAARRIWYCGFVAVRPGTENSGVFAALVEAMYRAAAPQDGIIGLDLCRHDDQVSKVSRAVRLMLHRLSGDVRAQRADEQAYWLYEFPAA